MNVKQMYKKYNNNWLLAFGRMSNFNPERKRTNSKAEHVHQWF